MVEGRRRPGCPSGVPCVHRPFGYDHERPALAAGSPEEHEGHARGAQGGWSPPGGSVRERTEPRTHSPGDRVSVPRDDRREGARQGNRGGQGWHGQPGAVQLDRRGHGPAVATGQHRVLRDAGAQVDHLLRSRDRGHQRNRGARSGGRSSRARQDRGQRGPGRKDGGRRSRRGGALRGDRRGQVRTGLAVHRRGRGGLERVRPRGVPTGDARVRARCHRRRAAPARPHRTRQHDHGQEVGGADLRLHRAHRGEDGPDPGRGVPEAATGRQNHGPRAGPLPLAAGQGLRQEPRRTGGLGRTEGRTPGAARGVV